MADFFKTGATSGSPLNSVVISTPGNGAAVVGAVHLVASASEGQAVSQTQVWDNHAKLGVYGSQIDATYDLAPGNHTTTVVDLNSSFNVIHQASVNYIVQALVDGIQIVSPTPNQKVDMSTVHVVAHATESKAINQMQVWDNGVKLGWYSGADVNQYFSLGAGSHNLTVMDLDSSYNVIDQSSVTYSMQ
jgi:phosphatidylinositol-3-phosphatase